jgi:hypothetical protein
MYEELVRQLRTCIDENIPCENAGCGYKPFGNEDCIDQLMRRAADAIEELSREYESVAASLNESVELVRKLQSPRWIPVTERLPGREWVLCKCRANIHEVLSLRDGYWYHDPQHQYMSGFVTHWMPLPEKPKEEEK